MTTPDELRTLADRVEAGEDGYPLETEVRIAVRPFLGRECGGLVDDDGRFSLDVCEALRREMLPGWLVEGLTQDYDGTWCLDFLPPKNARCLGQTAEAPTEPAARLAAVLRALAAEKETDR